MPFIEMDNTSGGVGWGKAVTLGVQDITNSKCLLDIQVEIVKRSLNASGFQGEVQIRCRCLGIISI